MKLTALQIDSTKSNLCPSCNLGTLSSGGNILSKWHPSVPRTLFSLLLAISMNIQQY